jgi:autotransporter translocation and assembly factor TamB
VEIEVEMAGGGRLSGRGSASLEARIDLEFELDAFPVDPVAPYLGDAAQLAGTLSGKVSARGDAADPDPLGFDLVLSDGDVRFDELTLIGRVAIRGEIHGGLEAPTGRFEADATQAELRFGEVYAKPPGWPKTIQGRLVTRPDGRFDIEELKVEVRNVEAHGKVELGERVRAIAGNLPGAAALRKLRGAVRPQP